MTLTSFFKSVIIIFLLTILTLLITRVSLYFIPEAGFAFGILFIAGVAIFVLNRYLDGKI